MAKVFGVHEIELRPGVKGEDFERFFTEEVAQLAPFQGWKTYLAKADRGTRDGQYALIFEIESVAARNRYAPQDGHSSEEAERAMAPYAAVMEKWSKLATTPLDTPIASDYVVIGASAD